MILLVIAGLVLVTGSVCVLIRFDRVTRQRAEQRLAAWKAAGEVGPPPGDYIGLGSGSSS
jgi:hypothetical protein